MTIFEFNSKNSPSSDFPVNGKNREKRREIANMSRFLPILKLLLIVVVGLFVLKFLSKAAAQKFPNKATQTIDSVIQTV